MIPSDLRAVLPPEISSEEAQAVRLSTGLTNPLGESYLVSHRGQFWLFSKSSLLDSLVAIPLRPDTTPQLLGDSFTPTLYLTHATGEAIKLQISMIERDEVQALLAPVITPTTEPAAPVQQEADPSPTPDAAPPLVATTPPLETNQPAAVPLSEAPSAAAPLDHEALLDRQYQLEEEVETALTQNNFAAAANGLRSLCALPLEDPDDLEQFRAGLAAVQTLAQGDAVAAFLRAGDPNGFYCDFQDLLAPLLAEALLAKNETLFAAAAFLASDQKNRAAPLLQTLGINKDQLSPRFRQEYIARLQQHLRDTPDDDIALAHLALISFEEKRFPEALVAAQRVMALAPQREIGYRLAVDSLTGLSQNEQANAVAQEAIRCCPQKHWSHTLRGDTLQDKDDLSGAKEEYRLALSMNPRDFLAMDGLRTVLRTQKDYPALAAHLEEALENFSYQEEGLCFELARLYEGPLRNPLKARTFRARAKGKTPAKAGNSLRYIFWLISAGLLVWWLANR